MRAAGLFIGVELTSGAAATAVVEHARRRGVLLSTDGPNVLKVKPPLAIGDADAERFLATLDDALAQRP